MVVKGGKAKEAKADAKAAGTKASIDNPNKRFMVGFVLGRVILLCGGFFVFNQVYKHIYGDDAAGAGGWIEVLPTHENADHLDSRPRFRYSHTATPINGEVVVAMGYFYDLDKGMVDGIMISSEKKGGPVWVPDVWAHSVGADDPELFRWRKVADVGGKGQPLARMNHIAVPHPTAENKLVIYAGWGVGNNIYNDLWELHTTSGRWVRLAAKAKPRPPRRHSFDGAVTNNCLLVYGGFGGAGAEAHGDVWSYSFEENVWEQLDETPKVDTREHPGRRGQHTVEASSDGLSLYVYGGFRAPEWVTDKTMETGKLSDLWRYNIQDKKWQVLTQGGKDQGGRAGFAMTVVPWRGGEGLAVLGGTQCVGECEMVGSLSVYSTQEERWYEVKADLLRRFHHTVAYAGGNLWTFGGETFTPHTYHNALLRLPWPPAQAQVHGGEL